MLVPVLAWRRIGQHCQRRLPDRSYNVERRRYARLRRLLPSSLRPEATGKLGEDSDAWSLENPQSPFREARVSDMPLVSVIVNNYNYGRFLRQAIDSALNQAYPYTEVIV